MTGRTESLPPVACIVTEYRPRSHADVIVSKLIGGHTYPAPYQPEKFDYHKAARQFSELPLPLDAGGRLRRPRVRVASLYLDQVPANDLGREWAARAGIEVSPTIRHALTLGGERLAVDGVILIGEHGDYPENERGQQLYPRRRFFEEAVAVMRESGRFVPVFNDKHLGYAWADAKWMVDTARELGIPLMAGSSLSTQPVSWRRPPLDLPLETRIEAAVVAGYGPLERYGIHMLEVLQSMVERRAGGETGVASVQCLGGAAVWEAETRGAIAAGSSGHWDADVLDAALARVADRPDGDRRALAKEPHVFLLEYRDGLRAAVFLLNGVLAETAFAARVTLPGASRPEVVSSWINHYGQEPFGHFAHLVEHIQDLILTRVSPVPIERTLLTTGILDRVMESHWRGGVRLETPELAIHYRPSG